MEQWEHEIQEERNKDAYARALGRISAHGGHDQQAAAAGGFRQSEIARLRIAVDLK